jgi:hypothetical protein
MLAAGFCERWPATHEREGLAGGLRASVWLLKEKNLPLTDWRLAFVADFGTRNFNFKINLIWKTKLQQTKKTAMTLTAC